MINTALGFGEPALLIKTVESVTGPRINHYDRIGFGGLVRVVDYLGDVRICLRTFHDTDSGANFKARCQTMDGAQALAFARDRHRS